VTPEHDQNDTKSATRYLLITTDLGGAAIRFWKPLARRSRVIWELWIGRGINEFLAVCGGARNECCQERDGEFPHSSTEFWPGGEMEATKLEAAKKYSPEKRYWRQRGRCRRHNTTVNKEIKRTTSIVVGMYFSAHPSIHVRADGSDSAADDHWQQPRAPPGYGSRGVEISWLGTPSGAPTRSWTISLRGRARGHDDHCRKQTHEQVRYPAQRQ